MSRNAPIIVWFRHDLRMADHAALDAARREGTSVIPVFIWAPEEEGDGHAGAASKWWLHQALRSLATSLEKRGSRLSFQRGPSLPTLLNFIKETGAIKCYWNRRYEPEILKRDEQIITALKESGIETQTFAGALLVEPWEANRAGGQPYKVFTPFWRHVRSFLSPAKPLPAPAKLPAPRRWPRSLHLEDLGLEPKVDWTGGFRDRWMPGERGARRRLKAFVNQGLLNYETERNSPGIDGTSRLSPHLHFGEVTPGQVWHEVIQRTNGVTRDPSHDAFLAELGWREFSHHVLYHFPRLPLDPMQEKFKHFSWNHSPAWLKRWQKGLTGYPMVDAGMRELWATGWMHNRVRMLVASFLVKDLRLPWQQGAAWFWDTLVDADLAQNSLNWQWCAGCGVDAAPYFRIFNPLTQGQKYDPHGDYVRRWVPELAALPARWIHKPFEAPKEILRAANIQLGKAYPHPIVSHVVARLAALDAFSRIKGRR